MVMNTQQKKIKIEPVLKILITSTVSNITYFGLKWSGIVENPVVQRKNHI